MLLRANKDSIKQIFDECWGDQELSLAVAERIALTRYPVEWLEIKKIEFRRSLGENPVYLRIKSDLNL